MLYEGPRIFRHTYMFRTRELYRGCRVEVDWNSDTGSSFPSTSVLVLDVQPHDWRMGLCVSEGTVSGVP